MNIDLAKFLSVAALMSQGVATAGCTINLGGLSDTNIGPETTTTESTAGTTDDTTSTGTAGETTDGTDTGTSAPTTTETPTSTTEATAGTTEATAGTTGEGFVCSDGTALENPAWVCDENPDCPDGSDEVSGCGLEAFTCTDKKEIPATWACDEVPDCLDNSDEVTGCGLEAFLCTNGTEIPATWKCDMADDCPDGADEADC
ncbi:hypothetical protein OV203_41055 [Nannocystis sp. ILAH1]|uniref:hypothetical protein n=1 Tax=unclassified Nannocystis TaxID=2627009 RepID=UPI00227136F0|nr:MULTISPECIES: hypothetical protein [unclassified Nannocystis]MCY0993599.1 hypothetical protein [Nannocystis sp. ILAH1]MCY1063674.1 hypothetical protein [Nannocystis sp. RBIL2]